MLSGLKSEVLTAVRAWFGLYFFALTGMKKIQSILTRLFSDDLLRHAGILFSGSMVVHVCNFLFQMAVSRALPGEEYTLLMAFLAVLAIIARPLSTLTTGISHYSSLLRQDDRVGDVKRLLRKWLMLTGVPAFFLGALAVVFNESLAGFLHLERVAPVVIAGAVLPGLFWLPILGGAGLGLQFFKLGVSASIFGTLVRLGLGAGFVWFLYPACGWAMLGHGLSVYASGGVLFLGLLWMLRGKVATNERLPSMRFYLVQSFFVLAAYAVLFTADVIFVKHYLPEDLEFAKAATLGRLVAFLPGAIVMAMFPKVASRGAGSQEQHGVFMRSLGLTALVVAAAVMGCFLCSGLLARILFGIADASVDLKRMIGAMSLVMGFSALLNVMVHFLLAQRRFKTTLVVVGAAILYGTGVFFFHATTWQIIWVAGGANLLALLAMFGIVCMGKKNVRMRVGKKV